MGRFYTREQLHLALPNPARLSQRSDVVVGITLHCTGAPTNDTVSKWRQIQALAMTGALPSGDRYGDHPYNAGVNLGGDIYAGRDTHWNGAHAASTHNVANRTTDGIALIGDGHTLTVAAEAAIRGCVYLFEVRYKRKPLIFDHLDWHALGGIATACPGPAMVSFTARLRAELRAAS